MKTAKTTTKLIAMAIALVTAAAIWFTWGARHAQAIQDSEDFPSPIGIARGQTVRLTVLNIGERAVVGPEYRLLDSAGRTLAKTPEPHLIPPAQFRSFDFDLPEPPPGLADNFGRIQARAVMIGNPKPKNLRVSLEVFDNDTGKTTIFFPTETIKGFNPQPDQPGIQ
ncbi:MAG TPA: hypothetical protein VJ810_35290 [Blastocatellia bacterium]|nr:hypothetical protein [Blastocatellia bacterium]